MSTPSTRSPGSSSRASPAFSEVSASTSAASGRLYSGGRTRGFPSVFQMRDLVVKSLQTDTASRIFQVFFAFVPHENPDKTAERARVILLARASRSFQGKDTTLAVNLSDTRHPLELKTPWHADSSKRVDTLMNFFRDLIMQLNGGDLLIECPGRMSGPPLKVPGTITASTQCEILRIKQVRSLRTFFEKPKQEDAVLTEPVFLSRHFYFKGREADLYTIAKQVELALENELRERVRAYLLRASGEETLDESIEAMIEKFTIRAMSTQKGHPLEISLELEEEDPEETGEVFLDVVTEVVEGLCRP